MAHEVIFEAVDYAYRTAYFVSLFHIIEPLSNTVSRDMAEKVRKLAVVLKSCVLHRLNGAYQNQSKWLVILGKKAGRDAANTSSG